MQNAANSIMRMRAHGIFSALFAGAALLASALPGLAQSATWSATPGSGIFNDPGNWSTGSMPTGTATFGTSTVTNLTVFGITSLDAWTFLSGAPAYTITNTGLLSLNGGGITTNGGSVSIVNNFGLGFDNASTAGSADIVNNNHLGFSTGSTAGSANIVNNGTLEFQSSTTAGDATITTNSGGTTRFNGNSSGAAARFIIDAGGTLNISTTSTGTALGSIEGAGNIDLGAKKLVVGGNNRSTVFSGVIDGTILSGLTKTGTGTLTLTGTNTYAGVTNIDGGTLLVDGSIASDSNVFVNSGGTLGGTGTIGFTLLDNGATLAPGTPTSIGNLTINHRVTFCACSTFAVKISSSGNDSVSVAGGFLNDAILGGVVKVSSLDGTVRFASPYTILTTVGGLNGTQFDSLVLPTGLTGALGYTANDVTLTLNVALGQTPGLGGNQQRIANVIDTMLNGGNDIGALNGVFGGDINGKLGQLAGQPATGLAPAGMQMTGSFLSTMLHPTGGSASGGAIGFAAEPQPSSEAALAYAAVTPKDRRATFAPVAPLWSVWGQFYGGQRSADGNAATGAADTTTRTYGMATGFDYRASADIVVGLALAGGSTNYGLADGLGGGKSDVFQLGVYGTKKFGAVYLSAALSYAWHDASTDRTVTVAGMDKLVADFSAHSFGGRFEGGYRVDTATLGVTPYAAVQVQAFSTSAYGETATLGSSAFALSYDARTVNATRTELGAWFDKTVLLEQGSTVTWRARAAWAHDFNNDQSVNAAFHTLPGASFTVNGARSAPNAALLSAGAELRLINNWSVAAKFDGEFASGARTYAGTGTLRYVW